MFQIAMRPVGRRGMVGLVLCMTLAASGAHAQHYPQRAVRVVVSQAAGSSADTIARILATRLSARWSTPVVVDNRPGANGNVGMEAVARASADGYTLGLATPSVMTVNPVVYRNMPFRPLEDLVAIAQTTSITFGLFCNPRLPVKTVAELVAYAKARPEGINASSAGVGNLGHLAAELFAEQADLRMTHIPNKGDTPGLLDVATGQTDLMFAPLPSAMNLMQGHRVRLLAVAARLRSPQFPEVPTLAEAGLPKVVTEGWTGLVAPTGTPMPVLEQLEKSVHEVQAQDEVRQSIQRQGFDIAGGSSENFAQLMRQETHMLSDLIRASGLKLGE
jgi:tripartite-type tricarboxylate transporter receptor subunit TctC